MFKQPSSNEDENLPRSDIQDSDSNDSQDGVPNIDEIIKKLNEQKEIVDQLNQKIDKLTEKMQKLNDKTTLMRWVPHAFVTICIMFLFVTIYGNL